MSRLSFLDLFGAPGGMSLGFKMAGIKPVGALDIFEDGLKTYERNFTNVPKQNIVRADASESNIVEQFSTITGLERGDVDVIIGGPPCQGFSTMGRIKIASLVKSGQREGRSHDPRFIDDERNNLYKAFIKFVAHFKPQAIVMENVPGMMSYRDGWVVKQIKSDFRKTGYENVDCDILNAAHYGTPQNRRRIIYVATRKNRKLRWPEKTHFDQSQFDRSLIDPSVKPFVTVMDAVGDLPAIRNRTKGSKARDNPMPYRGRPSCEFQWWIRNGSRQVHNHVTRWHREEDLKVFSHMKPGMKWSDLPYSDRKLIGYSNESFDDKWKRLPTDKPSWTVVSHLQKDGYMYIHPTQDRTISVREAARLQSFPDTFIFEGSRSSQFKQIGNAVPPLLALALARQVKAMLSS